jgi:hypothetical protein
MYKGVIFNGFAFIPGFIKTGQLVKDGKEFTETLADGMIVTLFLSSEGMELGQRYVRYVWKNVTL